MRRNGHGVLEFQKAFDKVPHIRLLSKITAPELQGSY